MPVNQDDNPFTMVYTALVRLLLSNPKLKQMVEIGSLLRFDLDRVNDPTKSDATPGDMPEIMLVPSGFSANIGNTSSTSSVLRQYTLRVATGSLRLNALMNQVQWEIFVALSNWKEVLGALQWRDAAFCKRFAVLTVDEGLSNPDANRKIRGWAAVWSCEIEMHFRKSEVIRFVPQ